MAIARDAVSGLTASVAAALTVTVSHTITGVNTYLIVYVADQQGDTVTGVTYNGVAMTQLKKETRDPNTGSLEIYAYGLANPATGTHNIVATRTGTVGKIVAGGVSYTGASQTTSPVDATASANGAGSTGTTLAVSITTVANNTAVSGFYVMDNGGISSVTNGTIIGSTAESASLAMFEASSFPVTPAGSKTYTVNAASGDRGGIVISLAPYVTPNVGSFLMMIK